MCVDDDPCTSRETCERAFRTCKWDMLDADGDGHTTETCGGGDFDDNDETSFAGAIDVCAFGDNDRDGMVDEDCLPPACDETELPVVEGLSAYNFVHGSSAYRREQFAVSDGCFECLSEYRACFERDGWDRNICFSLEPDPCVVAFLFCTGGDDDQCLQ